MVACRVERVGYALALMAGVAGCQLPPSSVKPGTGKIDAGTGVDGSVGPSTVTPTYEAETMTAVDPRPGSQLAYAATIESTFADAAGTPTRSCIIRKQIHV